MNLYVQGEIVSIEAVQQITEKFKKREFVLQIDERFNETVITNYAKFQVLQQRVSMLDSWTEGDVVKVSFNIRGNCWERDGKQNFSTNLEAWKIEAVPQFHNVGNHPK